MSATESGFWARVDQSGGLFECWPWTGRVDEDGYGLLSGELAHRLAWRFTGRTIPESRELDHLCRNRSCVNPGHTEAVTQAENKRRQGEARTACKNGHPYVDGSYRLDHYRGWTRRICLACQASYKAAWKARHAA